ncbi:MAG TPA: tetratricopeptide repeat protein [Candidatus Angelobacter sp.]|nr:tetratricopeptide repeat protein [Candidatus Angelobacter sp.]
MKRNTILLALAAVLSVAAFLPAHAQTVGAPVQGKVTRDGSPFPNAQVVLTNADTGKTYKSKSEKSGDFSLLGVPYGNYQVEVIGDKGEKLFSEKTSLGTGSSSGSNFLKIDIVKGAAVPDAGAAAAPKLTKEQLAKIEADNKKIAGLNSLINDAENARKAQDWPKAESALKQLIAAAPDTSRWEFYMYLGEAQSKSNQLQEAAQTLDKGIQIAQSLASGATPPDPKNPQSTPAAAKSGEVRMLTSQGSIYLKLQKPDEAIAALKKAAALDPSSALGQYNLCGVQFSAQKYDDAKTTCNKYLQLEPSGPHSAEVKAFLTQMGQK